MGEGYERGGQPGIRYSPDGVQRELQTGGVSDENDEYEQRACFLGEEVRREFRAVAVGVDAAAVWIDAVG